MTPSRIATYQKLLLFIAAVCLGSIYLRRDLPYDLFSGLLSILALLGDIWLELKKSDYTQHQILHNVKASFSIDPVVLDHAAHHATAVRLLERAKGVMIVRRGRILQDIHVHLTQRYNVDFGYNSEEYARITILADVVRHASRYVSAYTFADPAYVKRFWGSKHPAISDYFDAHRQALHKHKGDSSFSLKRVFVVPDDLAVADPDAYRILVGAVAELRELGMTHLYYRGETETRKAFTDANVSFPDKSFLIADDEFVSAGERLVQPGGQAFCTFTTDPGELRPYIEQFTVMEQMLGGELTRDRIKELLSHVKLQSRQNATASSV